MEHVGICRAGRERYQYADACKRFSIRGAAARLLDSFELSWYRGRRDRQYHEHINNVCMDYGECGVWRDLLKEITAQDRMRKNELGRRCRICDMSH